MSDPQEALLQLVYAHDPQTSLARLLAEHTPTVRYGFCLCGVPVGNPAGYTTHVAEEILREFVVTARNPKKQCVRCGRIGARQFLPLNPGESWESTQWVCQGRTNCRRRVRARDGS
jgi:hypothetical protein